MWEESLGTQAGVHLIEGVRLIQVPLYLLNTKAFITRSNVLASNSHTPVNILIETFRVGLQCKSLISNIHVMIN